MIRTLRSLGSAGLAGWIAVLTLPRSVPPRGSSLDAAGSAADAVAFGLRAVVALLAGYVAVVLVVATVGAVPRWTQRGLASLICRAAGLAVVAGTVVPTGTALPTTLTAAAGAPVLEPVERSARATPLPPESPTARPIEHVVASGESFWTIAADHVAADLGRTPSDPEVAGYWLDLIEANRAVLAHPDDPDLLYPGQVLRLPG